MADPNPNELVASAAQSTQAPLNPAQNLVASAAMNPMAAAGPAPSASQINAASPVRPVNVQPKTIAPNPVQAHHSVLGRAVESLFTGGQTEYSVDPATGKTVPTFVKNKPGQVFRNILAGAILGGAAGSGGRNFAEGVGRGGTAVMERNQQMDELRRQHARQEFEDSIKAQENKRQADLAQSQMDLNKSHSALLTQQVALTGFEMQGKSLELHKDLADWGKSSAADLSKAGLTPVYSGIREDQVQQFVKDHPGASSLAALPTGIEYGVDAKGNPEYFTKYDFFDVNKKVKISDATAAQWKKEGVFDRFPEYKGLVGQDLNPYQYLAAQSNAESVYRDNLAKKEADLTLQAKSTEIQKNKAEASRAWAEASVANVNLKKDNLLTVGWAQYSSPADSYIDPRSGDISKKKSGLAGAGGDLSKVDPKYRVYVAREIISRTDEEIKNLSAAYKAAVTAGSAEAKDLYDQIQDARDRQKQANDALTGGTKPAGTVLQPTGNVAVDRAASSLSALPAAEQEKQISASTQNDDTKNAIRQALNLPIPTKKVGVPNIGGAIKSGAKAVANFPKQAVLSAKDAAAVFGDTERIQKIVSDINALPSKTEQEKYIDSLQASDKLKDYFRKQI